MMRELIFIFGLGVDRFLICFVCIWETVTQHGIVITVLCVISLLFLWRLELLRKGGNFTRFI